MTKNWRSHRFTPLGELMGSDAWRSGVPLHLSPSARAAQADGFQQGMERGYREGFEKGERDGREQGFDHGFAEGRSQGSEAARTEVRQRFDAMATPIDALRGQLERLQEDYQTALRKEVVELVAKVARQVIRCELALQPAQLLALVDETLATMPNAPGGSIEVYLNPADLQRIQEIDHARVGSWSLQADARLEPGECRVRRGTHEADAGCHQRLGACMEQISEQLLQREGDQPAPAESLEDAA